jgi:Flp pilus assembly protein TadD
MKLTVKQALTKAQQLLFLGKTAEAEPILRAVLRLDPKNKPAQAQLDKLNSQKEITPEERSALMGLFNKGDFAGAIEMSAKLQRRFPTAVMPCTIMGASYAQTDQPAKAEKSFRRAVTLNPKFHQGFNNLGNSLKEQRKLDKAREAYLKAVKLDPKFAQAFNNLAVVLKEMKRFPQAERRFHQAIALDPNYVEAHRNLGVLYQETKAHDKAISCFKKCLIIAPQNLEAMSYLADSLKATEQFHDAVTTLSNILKINENNLGARQALGVVLAEVGDFERAITELRRVVEAKPRSIVALIHLGNALSKTSDLDGALDAFDQVLKMDPNNQGALNNIGVIQQNRGDLIGAAQTFDAALAIDPSVSELQMNRAVVHFLQCEFDQAWPLYESRFKHEKPATPFLETSKPIWRGEKARVFVWAEQGIGDEVFFASLLIEAQKMASQLIVSVDKRLLPIFERSFSGIEFVPRGTSVQETAYDAHIPSGHLAGLLRKSVSDFQNQVTGYLKPVTENIKELKQKLGPFDGNTIGIAWHTQNRKSGNVRNIDLEMFVRAFKGKNVRFVNLQYGDTDAEIETAFKATGTEVITIAGIDRFNDIDGLCALIAACDRVVTIDNSTVHFSAAMGIETHLIVPFFPDWRWPDVQNGSLWYPGLNIYRQNARFGWPAVLDRISQDIN